LFRLRSSTFSYRGIKRRGGAVAATPGCDPIETFSALPASSDRKLG